MWAGSSGQSAVHEEISLPCKLENKIVVGGQGEGKEMEEGGEKAPNFPRFISLIIYLFIYVTMVKNARIFQQRCLAKENMV